jgi:hypothetical protein
MESRDSLLSLEELSGGLISETDEASPQTHTLFPYIYHNIIFHSMVVCPKLYFTSRFSAKIYAFSISSIHAIHYTLCHHP